jgi:hypothetical protein
MSVYDSVCSLMSADKFKIGDCKRKTRQIKYKDH